MIDICMQNRVLKIECFCFLCLCYEYAESPKSLVKGINSIKLHDFVRQSYLYFLCYNLNMLLYAYFKMQYKMLYTRFNTFGLKDLSFIIWQKLKTAIMAIIIYAKQNEMQKKNTSHI